MRVKLEKVINEAFETKSFLFSTQKKFRFLPGQYIYVTLPKLKDDYRGPTRYFTISSSPTEKRFIKITTRIREISNFKQTLSKLKMGESIEIEGPSGTFILDEHESKNNHIFLAGGVGITPFRSIIKYNLDKKLYTKIHLIYSNRDLDSIVFRKELEKWSKKHKNIKLTMTITGNNSNTPSNYKNTKIDEKLLINLSARTPTGSIFWISGSPMFVDAMQTVLKNLEIPLKNINTDKFTGY